jgi:hypothetical protein
MKKYFIGIFVYFSAWGILAPPFQSPDEFSHYIKTCTLKNNPWLLRKINPEIETKNINPLIFFARLHQIPFHASEKINLEALLQIINTKWSSSKEGSTIQVRTTAYTYPPIYYHAVSFPAQFATKTFQLSPFFSNLFYRLTSAFIASLLWCTVIKKIPVLHFRNGLIFLTIFNPMLGFISGCINPDAFTIPLSILAMIYAYDSLFLNKNLYKALFVTILVCLVKASGLILLPIFLLAGIWKRNLKNTIILVLGAYFISKASYYWWCPFEMSGGTTGVNISLFNYFVELPSRFQGWMVAFWGKLGWLDHNLPISWYYVMWSFILLNLPFIEYKNPFVQYQVVSCILYVVLVVGTEFAFLSSSGYTMQGRHFLPASMGLLICVCNNKRILHYIPIFVLAAINILIFQLSWQRYYTFSFFEFVSEVFRSFPR